MNKRSSRLVYVLLVSLILAGAIALRQADPFVLRAVRLVAFDFFHQLNPAEFDPGVPVRVVDIDEESLARMGQWPWPRTRMRDLLLALSEAGAAAIAFDLLFIEADRTSPEELLKLLPQQQASLLAPHVSQLGNDKAFASALAATPSVLAMSLLTTATDVAPPKAGFAVAGDDPASFIVSFSGASTNLAVLNEAARGIGAINWIPDRDQVVRRINLIYRANGQYVPALAAETLRVAMGASTFILKTSNASGETAFGKATGLNRIRVGDIEIPTDAEGAVYPKFRRFTKATYIPAWKVLAGEIPSEDIAGKIILVGTSAPGLFDLRATPLNAAVPGVDVHAQLLEQMLKGQLLSRPDYAPALELFIVLSIGILLAIVLPRVSAKISLAIGSLTMLIVVAGGWIAFRYGDLLIDVSYPVMALGALTAAITGYVYLSVEAQQGAIRDAFGRYLSPVIIQELIANPDKLELGGEERELTLMFCDVRNFTSIAQGLTPSELTRFINELLSPLSEIILERRGTIDKYMGDAIMAFWNAPVDDPEHATNACRAALQMASKMEELNARWKEQASTRDRPFQQVNVGIGINTGRCCVGNLGSAMRFDYSAIGDEVNVASRLDGLTKLYGLSNLVGERTIAMMRDVAALEVDLVQVKGRTGSTRIYTLLSDRDAMNDELDALIERHQNFLAAYRQREWDEAERRLADCVSMSAPSLQTYYEVFRSRIDILRQTAPPPNWDGSFVSLDK